MQDAGILDTGYWLLDTRCWMVNPKSEAPDPKHLPSDLQLK